VFTFVNVALNRAGLALVLFFKMLVNNLNSSFCPVKEMHALLSAMAGLELF
jgi:hypothetical protein